MKAIKPMHNLSTAFKQSESDRSMAAKMLIAPGHPLPQVFTCKLRATAIFYQAGSINRNTGNSPTLTIMTSTMTFATARLARPPG